MYLLSIRNKINLQANVLMIRSTLW